MSSRDVVTSPDRASQTGPRKGAVMVCAEALLAAFVFFACFAFSDMMSPYDLVALPAMGLWLLLGVRLHRGALPLVWLLMLYLAAITIALVPYLGEEISTSWTIQLAYLAITAIFFAMLVSEQTEGRMEIVLKAYVASCVFSALCGTVGYLHLLGIEDLFYRWDRATGTFKDPNVFGSYLILGALYLMHGLMTGGTRRPIMSFILLLIVMSGVFLSFSRGSWGATGFATILMVGSLFLTTHSGRLRRRIVLVCMATVVVGFVALIGLLSMDGVAKTFETRAAATQSYDEGETGRFGNQARGLKMLIELPFGMGPLRWRRIFEVEPHNSYIGSFANGGWLGGAVFILLVAATIFVAFRLMRRDTPFRRHTQIVAPSLTVFFMQAVQIDIEKWRHVYMMLGMIWGLEAARLLWERDQARRQVMRTTPDPMITGRDAPVPA